MSTESQGFDMRRFGMIIGVVALLTAPAVAWGMMSSRLDDQAKRIEKLEGIQQYNAELLYRIDENVKALKERLAGHS